MYLIECMGKRSFKTDKEIKELQALGFQVNVLEKLSDIEIGFLKSVNN